MAGETALILRVVLPPKLEELRRRMLRPTDLGLPAHVTLLYPFMPLESVDDAVRQSVGSIVRAHSVRQISLTGPRLWPGTLYAAVGPSASLMALQAELAMAFPHYPLYGGAFAFEPHVTISADAATLEVLSSDPAWASLPALDTADTVELIEKGPDGWNTRWQWRSTRPVRILVCGERLRGDDAAAPLAVAALPADVRALVEILDVGQLEIESVMDVPDGAALIVADAAVGVAPGDVVTLPLAAVARPGVVGPSSTHAMPPDQIIALGAELRGSMPDGKFVGIGVASFDFGEPLSPSVAAGLPAFTDALAAAILELAARP